MLKRFTSLVLSLGIFSQCHAAVMEVVIIQFKPGVSEQAILKAEKATTPLLKAMPGFTARTFGKSTQPHEWLDQVHWCNMHDAIAAAKKIDTEPLMQQYNALMQSYKMYHFQIMDHSGSAS